jgi:hypothetical protein
VFFTAPLFFKMMLAYKTVSTIFLAWLCGVDALIVPSSVNCNRSSRSFSTSLLATASTTHRRKNEASKQTSGASVITTQEPWLADYSTSVRSQKKIQSVPSKLRGKNVTPIQVAQAVLNTFLNIPPAECNAANVVCALTTSAKTLSRGKHGNSKLNTTSEDLQNALMQTIDILKKLVTDRRLTARQLCNAAWAIAKHVEFDESLFSRKNDKYIFVEDGTNSYSTWDLSQQQINGDGTDKHIDDVLNLIALRMVEHLDQTRDRRYRIKTGKRAQPGELSMLLWAYAAAKPRDCPPGWEQPRRIEQLSDKQSNSGEDVDVVTFVEESKSRANDSQHRSTTSRLFDAAAIAFCQGEGAAVIESEKENTLLKNCTWNELSNIAWSFATRGAYASKESEAVMTFIAKEATRRILLTQSDGRSNKHGILPRDCVQIAWALGMMESDNVSVGDAYVHLVDAINDYWITRSGHPSSQPLKEWKCADLVQMATALAHGRLDNQSVLSAVYKEALRRLSSRNGLSISEVSILLWSQARMYLTKKFGPEFAEFPSAASDALLQRIGKSSVKMPPQEQANLAWSLTVLEQYDDNVITLLQKIFNTASSCQEGVIQLEHAHQLWQSYFLLSADCPEAVESVPEEFTKYLEHKWNLEKSRCKKSSKRHQDISKTLDLMRVAHRNEYDEDVDVAIVLEEDSAWTHTAQSDFDIKNGRKVAVEFDGPHHFTVMASTGEQLSSIERGVKINPRVLGHTVLKYRLLKKKGWTVVRIPYYEFDRIPRFASMEIQRYLQRALKTHDKIEFSGVDVSEYKAMPSSRTSRFD